jgi:hypothetical protein
MATSDWIRPVPSRWEPPFTLFSRQSSNTLPRDQTPSRDNPLLEDILLEPPVEIHSHHLIHPPSMLSSPRKFSYNSVKEDNQDTPQSFAASLSSEELEEVEWIAWPCSQWCRTKGLCSHHSGGCHDDYIQARLEGYARSNPRKLQKILQEIDKRRQAQRYGKLPTGAVVRLGRNRSDSGLDIWREKLRKVLAQPSLTDDEDAIVSDSEDDELESRRPKRTDALSPLETLPHEIQDLIFSYTTVDHTADPYARPHTDLCSLSLVSRSLHEAALRVMYRHVSIPQSKSFTKFLRSLTEDESLGKFVKWLDFSHYSNVGFGRARSTSVRTPFLTPTTIKECLDRLPMLQAFLVHEHVDDELDINVLSKLFCLPQMQALDFTACSSKSFTEAFTNVCTLMPGRDHSMLTRGSFSHPLKRLSLHECTTLQEPVFEALLPRLTNLTHLDVAHTLINDKALMSIPSTAMITHLNLERCTRLTGGAVVRFLTSHPAPKDTIVYLNLMADASRHRLLSEEDVSRLLPALPLTVRSLNIGGARINPIHVPALRQLATHVEELGLKGANLGLSADIDRIFTGEDGRSHATTIRYLDLSDIKSVTQMSLSYHPTALTGAHTEPLEVIEVGSSVLDEIKRRTAKVKNPSWVVRELGRRGWYVRQPKSTGPPADDGSRRWKMGARWWGMRKLPMVQQDVGGMYGYFMFKRN